MSKIIKVSDKITLVDPNGQLSMADMFAMLPKEVREQLLAEMTDEEAEALLYDWKFWGRPKQHAPQGDWLIWLILAGRGFGKTRTGAEFVKEKVLAGEAKRIALVGPTAGDVRDTMIEGESGLLNVFPPKIRPKYEPSKRRVIFHNGAVATAFSAKEYERLRGPQHDLAWCDELAAWQYPQEAWDNLMFGLRLGNDPRVVVTTTPKPIPLIKELVQDPSVHVTTGTSFENEHNLARSFKTQIIDKYKGTRVGLQELEAVILDDNPNALWSRSMLDKNRVIKYPTLQRIVVGVDPAATGNKSSNETGIIVAGLGTDGHAYVLDDVSVRGKPDEWAKAAVAAFHKWEADRIVAEVNQGGDMVEHTIRTVDKTVPIKKVRATRGKIIRAEPVAALYEQGKVHHVGSFGMLETQLTDWEPGQESPDRLDALVWAITDLMIKKPKGRKRVKASA